MSSEPSPADEPERAETEERVRRVSLLMSSAASRPMMNETVHLPPSVRLASRYIIFAMRGGI